MSLDDLEPIIREKSPFRRLPATLPRRHMLHLDGLRLCAEIVDLAYRRLLTVIRQLTYDCVPLDGRQIGAFADAWTIIDSTYRFRLILAATPGLKHNFVFESFMRFTKAVEDLRHTIQHLNNEVENIANAHQAILGTLTWVAASPTPGAPPSSFLLTVGTEYPDKITFGPVVDLEATLASQAIDKVAIALSSHRVDLIDPVCRIRSMIRSLETPLAEYGKDKPALGSDRLVRFELTPIPRAIEKEDGS